MSALLGRDSPLLMALKPLRGHFFSAAGFSLFVNILMIVPAIYMLQVYDRAVGSGSTETLLVLTLIMVFLLASMGLLEWVRGQILVRAGAKLDELLAQRVFDASFGEAMSTGDQKTNAQAMTDLAGLRHFLSGNAPFAFMDVPWVPVYIAIMFLFHPWFGWLAVFSCLLLALLTWTNQRFTQAASAEANRNSMAGHQYAIQNLRNAEVVTAMGMLDRVRQQWQKCNDAALAQHANARDTGVSFGAISKSMRLCLQSLALGLGAWLAINLEITPGMMIAGSILLGRALAPIDQMMVAWKSAQSALLQAQRLDKLLRDHPETKTAMSLPAPKGALEVEQLIVSPPGSQQRVLQGIGFNLKAGAQLGIIGPSASGKSTLARAVLGIWQADFGVVRLDGADVSQWDRTELGPHIGYLPQDIELFSGTIAENITRFGESEPEQVVAAAEKAGVHEMILKLPNGYDTLIGPMGASLSGGQRQRIALARAVFKNPKLVILDEPNSNLDEQGELALDAALDCLREIGSTVLIISHKTRILQSVDQIMVLNEGRILAFDSAAVVLQRFQQTVPPKTTGSIAK